MKGILDNIRLSNKIEENIMAIYDREDELIQLEKRIKSKKFDVIFVLANEGFGKSSFIKKYLFEFSSKKNIYIELEKTENPCFYEGKYINLIASLLNDESERLEIHSFKEFISISENYNYIKKFSECLDNSIYTIPFKAIVEASQFESQRTQEWYNSIINKNVMDSFSYIEFVFSEIDSLLIGVENFEKIDPFSFELIKKLIAKKTNINFIFEYITTKESYSLLQDKLIQFKNLNITYDLYEINKLKYDDFCKICKDYKFEPLNNNLAFKNIYDSINGNLNHILFYYNLFNQKKPISLCKDSQLMLLSIIINNCNSIELEELKNIYYKIITSNEVMDFDFQEDYNILLSNGYINSQKNIIFISSPNIEELNKLIPFKINAIVINYLCRYYKNLYYETQNMLYFQNYIQQLCKIDLQNVLNQKQILINMVRQSMNPSSVSIFLNSLDVNMKEMKLDIYNQFYLLLASLSFESGDYIRAKQELNKLSIQTNSSIVFDLLIQHRLRNNEYVLKKIESLRKNELSERMILILGIIEIISLASMGNYVSARNLFDKFNIKKYQKYQEYGILLRNSSIVKSPKNCLTDLKNSITFFEKDNFQLGLCHITYSMNLVRIHKFNDAINHLLIAKDLLGKYFIANHIIINNAIAIQMKTGKYSHKQIIILQQQIDSISIKYDIVLMLLNILTISIELNDMDLCKKYVLKLEKEIENFDDNSLLMKVYKTLYFYYSNENNIIKMNETKFLFQDNKKKINLTEETSWRIPNFYVSNLKNVSYFLSYWHFSIDDFL